MNEKQLADRLRDIASNALDADVELRLLADELDPPKPEPGTVVWFEFVEDDPDPPELGIVSSSGNTVVDADGYCHRTEALRIKPARILGPRQVAVDVPPVRREWPYWANQIVATYRNSDTGRNGIMADIITREEAERMEARDDTA